MPASLTAVPSEPAQAKPRIFHGSAKKWGITALCRFTALPQHRWGEGHGSAEVFSAGESITCPDCLAKLEEFCALLLADDPATTPAA